MSNKIVLTKLINCMGPSRAREIMRDVLAQLGLVELRNADDRLLFGSVLIERGGASKLVGRTIALQARLHGARG